MTALALKGRHHMTVSVWDSECSQIWSMAVVRWRPLEGKEVTHKGWHYQMLGVRCAYKGVHCLDVLKEGECNQPPAGCMQSAVCRDVMQGMLQQRSGPQQDSASFAGFRRIPKRASAGFKTSAGCMEGDSSKALMSQADCCDACRDDNQAVEEDFTEWTQHTAHSRHGIRHTAHIDSEDWLAAGRQSRSCSAWQPILLGDLRDACSWTVYGW